MIKKIKLWIINKRIQKLHNVITELHNDLKWMQEHKHDFDVVEFLKCVKIISTQLKEHNNALYIECKNKERLLK